MGFAFTSVKYVMIIFNLLVATAGFVILGIGIAWFLKNDAIVKLFGRSEETLAVGIMAFGGFAAFIAFFGCSGAYTQNKILLTIFTICLVVLLAMKFLFVVLVIFAKNWWEESTKNASNPEAFKKVFSAITMSAAALEILALVVGCCLMNKGK